MTTRMDVDQNFRTSDDQTWRESRMI